MTPLPSFWPFKNAKVAAPPPAPGGLTGAELRDILQFTQGYLLAMQHGTRDLEARVLTQATEEALARLEPAVIARAEALGQTQVRSLVDLQAKQAEFQRKRDTAATDADRIRYTHYLDALGWLLSNGH